MIVPGHCPNGFVKKNCIVTSATQLENFPPYMRAKNEKFSSSLAAELEQIRYNKLPSYSTSIIRFALMLRYTSPPAYKLLKEEYN